MTAPRYRAIVDHYEACLEEHGDTHLGVDWPNAEDAETRHRVMLELVRDRPASLLDFGCGASHFYEHIEREGVTGIDYAGLDLSSRFVELSRAKHPGNRYWCADILDDALELPRFDYVVMNGVFTEKLDLPFDEMFSFVRRVVERVWDHTEKGLAFNVMSKHVDWERDDLFHVPFDELASWLIGSVSRNIVMRADYGLFEYTTYVYR